MKTILYKIGLFIAQCLDQLCPSSTEETNKYVESILEDLE